MRIRLLAVGRPRDPGLAALHDAYAARIVRLGASYRSSWVPEEKLGGRYTDEHVREREGKKIRDSLEGPETVVALDPGGRLLASTELPPLLERWAAREVVLVVGGPSGLHATVLERAGFRWSLSPLTFPHEMVRVLVAEQVYRALTLLRGVPYHR